MSHVAAVSWAETQQPETRLAIHSPTKTRFLSANQVDVFCCCSVAMAMKRTQEAGAKKSRSQEVKKSRSQEARSQEPGDGMIGMVLIGDSGLAAHLRMAVQGRRQRIGVAE